MNDWLDYQGSGSSRAYIAHYGVKGMKWDPSKLFGKPQETNKQKVEQIKANDKLVSALYEQYNKYEEEYGEANMNYKELDNILIPKQQQKITDAKDMLKELETKYSNLSKSSPLEATQRYSRNIWAQKKNIQELESGLEQLKKTQMDYKRKMEIASVKADDVHKKITEAEGDSAAISRSRRIKQSYFDMPADEFIMHAEKGGMSMNDWLDYQGSGSSRAYTNNTLSHAAKERVRFRDSINDTIGKVMDKVTDADHKASDAKNKQREAEERLEAAQISRKGKEIYDAANKLQSDASDVQWEGFKYLTKLDKAWDPLVAKMRRTTDPKALAQLDAAYRNLSNDVIRMHDKMSEKVSTLYDEYYRIQKMYKDFVYYYPTAYVSTVPSTLEDAKKNLDKADKSTNTFITYGNREIWK